MAGESAQETTRRARDKAGRLEAYAATCGAGSAGEAATASVLDQLPPGWTAVHDVRWPGRQRANLDHVVVGPGGIFVIDSKSWTGGLTVTDGVLRQNGHRREREVAATADAAAAVAELATPQAGSVQAVLCFTGQARVVGRAGDVALCHLDNLFRFLLTRPVVLDPQQIDTTVARLTTALAPAPRPAARTTPSAGRGPRPARRLTVSLVMVFAMLSLGPAVVRSVASETSHGSCDPRTRPATAPAKPPATSPAARGGACS